MIIIIVLFYNAEILLASNTRLIINCKELKDGFFAVDDTGCHAKYIECKKNITYFHCCSVLSAFDPKREKCVARKDLEACRILYKKNEIDWDNRRAEFLARFSLNYDATCRDRKDGKYGTFDCGKTVITCKNGKGLIDKCPGNLYFNKPKQNCDEEYNVKTCYEDLLKWSLTPPCAVLPHGSYGKRKETNYYLCYGRQLFTIVRQCAVGFAFSPETAQCENITTFGE